MSLPYLTGDFSGVGGSIKQRPEDFFVEELPIYQPSGEGEHVFCQVQKQSLTTFDAVDRLAKALHIKPRDIGYAGMKDAQAVTRQLFSIQGASEEAVAALKLPNMTVLSVSRHGNKLRLGHLRGNRFVIKIREVDPANVVKLQAPLDLIKQHGMPNYFGEQRFGRRGDNHLLGAALISGDDARVLQLLLGSPNPRLDDANTLGARKAFERGDYHDAMRLLPRRSGMERRILHRFIKSGKAGAAVHLIDQKLLRLWISALQSELFNDVVARRIGQLDKLMDGDLAWKHDNGACFHVEDAAAEQARCDAFEVSPTGPLVGYRLTLPQGKPLEIESQVFAEHQLSPEQFRGDGGQRTKGARRPLRCRPEEVELSAGVDDFGQHITIAFTLPSGSFATVLLRELMKSPE